MEVFLLLLICNVDSNDVHILADLASAKEIAEPLP